MHFAVMARQRSTCVSGELFRWYRLAMPRLQHILAIQQYSALYCCFMVFKVTCQTQRLFAAFALFVLPPSGANSKAERRSLREKE